MADTQGEKVNDVYCVAVWRFDERGDFDRDSPSDLDRRCKLPREKGENSCPEPDGEVMDSLNSMDTL